MGKFVVDGAHSGFARLRPVSVDAVTLSDDFWAPRIAINCNVTIPSQHAFLEKNGHLDNFRRAAGRKTGIGFQGEFAFNDSDVYKWLEAAS
jgi:hypothetical protein